MKHSDKCLKEQAEMKRLHDEYVEKWPNYCKGCDGAGVLTWTENQSPFGSGMYWPETLSEPCDKCLQIGKCPRCGGEYTDEDCEKPCSICGWNFDSQCPPEVPEGPCECEIEEWDKSISELLTPNSTMYEAPEFPTYTGWDGREHAEF